MLLHKFCFYSVEFSITILEDLNKKIQNFSIFFKNFNVNESYLIFDQNFRMFERLELYVNTSGKNYFSNGHEYIKMHLFLEISIPHLKISKMNSNPDIGYFLS